VKIVSLVFSLFIILMPNPVFSEEPLMINQIVVHPKNPKVLYAAARPQGVLKSVDRGKSWIPIRKGLKNTSVYHLVIPNQEPETLYLATFGGGVYKSENGGDSWLDINDGLGDTNIHALVIDPSDSKSLYAGTSTGEVFRSLDSGKHWKPSSKGLPYIEGEVIISLLFDRDRTPRLYLGEESLFARKKTKEGEAWDSVGDGLKKEVITTLGFDPDKGGAFYAGTMRDGLFVSADRGKSWKPVGALFRKKWIQKIFVGPSKPSKIYVSVLGEGLYKSSDRGKSWTKLHQGLPSGDDIMTLAIDPENPNQIYAGTHNTGIFVSSDGGSQWTAPEIKREPVASIIESLISSEQSTPEQKHLPPVPAAFNKCTKCHGWTDPHLSRKKTFWRVPPNRRDWRPTVKRMSPGAGLTPEEEETVINFLTSYSQAKAEGVN
jgi:photosystem II stability/assembly factor-like uncharacterized protein